MRRPGGGAAAQIYLLYFKREAGPLQNIFYKIYNDVNWKIENMKVNNFYNLLSFLKIFKIYNILFNFCKNFYLNKLYSIVCFLILIYLCLKIIFIYQFFALKPFKNTAFGLKTSLFL